MVADACHSLGARSDGRPVGSLADLTVFSLHPVKHITSGEGGVVATRHTRIADRVRRFRNHGIDRDVQQRQRSRSWYYEMRHLGYNYRLSDIQSALGLSQLGKLSAWLDRRREIARRYDRALAGHPAIEPLLVRRACPRRQRFGAA
jgi:perosamine synthetase